jgi:hypothetical protein
MRDQLVDEPGSLIAKMRCARMKVHTPRIEIHQHPVDDGVAIHVGIEHDVDNLADDHAAQFDGRPRQQPA